MSAIHTWACLLLCISYTRQDKPPDAHVTCVFSRECLLPCSFQPAAGGDTDEVIKWFRQKELVYTFFMPRRRDDDSGEELQQSVEDEQYALFPRLVSQGNATLVLRGCGIRDRGRYKCQVHTSAGVHEAHVIVKVEAPIRSLTLKLSRLSGYEEMMCATRDVYPAPDVTWATEPPSSEVLRPTTRKLPDKQSGLYTVESRMRRLKGLSEINYVCKVNSSYGTQAWTASLTERELHGVEGQGLTIPCHAPAYLLHAPSVSWSFAAGGGEVDEHILAYDSASGLSEESASPVWKRAGARVDTSGVSSGDGSLRLPVPHHAEHSGLYTCVYSAPHHTHTEHIDVVIAAVGEKLQGDSWGPSHWWIVALVVAVVALVLLAMLVHLKLKDARSKATKSSNEATELYTVKETAVDCTLSECSPLTVEDNNEHNGHKSGSTLT